MHNIVITLVRFKDKTHYVEEIKVNNEIITSFDFNLGKIDFQPLAQIIGNEKETEVVFITKYESDFKPTTVEKATAIVSRNKKNEFVLDIYIDKKERA
jgi:hypothetical protein|nr:MAG TPA: hypothetical protein [Caudoviricetes sp.]